MSDVCVRIPTALRAFAGGADEFNAAAGTVSEVLRQITERHPLLTQRILTPEGRLRPFVNIFVDRRNVRGLQELATAVPPGAVLRILPAVSGG